MTFEDRLLAELKVEVAHRSRQAAGRPRRAARRRLTGAAVAAAALAAVVVPTAVGSRAPAYAVTRNTDGSITVTIKELRDAGRLERELADRGARTDITYLPQHKRCGNTRGVQVDAPPPPPPGRRVLKESELPKAERDQLARQPLVWSAHGRPNSFTIYPRRIRPGRTLVVELAESHRTGLWKLGWYLVAGPVRPCVFENDPTWN